MTGPLIAVSMVLMLVFGGEEDTSVVKRTSKPLASTKRKANGVSVDPSLSGVIADASSHQRGSESNTRRGGGKVANRQPIKYKAKQVIERGDPPNGADLIPRGTRLIGKLLTAIDTRETGQLYKVLLPYGGSAKTGPKIPKDTILFGSVRYSGKGDKVFLAVSKGLLPNGREFEIKGQALDPATYAPGIIGDFHGKSSMRLATGLGLAVVAGAAEVMTEKESLGETGAVSPKSTMKNALYGGIAKSTQMESTRQMRELGSEPEYATIEAGEDIIISLTEPVHLNKSN